MDIRKLINMYGDEVIYVCKGPEAIEISIRRDGEMSLNYLGPFDNHMSSSEAFVDVLSDDNEVIFKVVQRLYENFLGFQEKSNEGLDNRYERIGNDVFELVDDRIVKWHSDGIKSISKNQFMIEPISGGYRIRFKKGKYLDGRLNRNYRVKVSLGEPKHSPFNSLFYQFYSELKGIPVEVECNQIAYNLSKKPSMAY